MYAHTCIYYHGALLAWISLTFMPLVYHPLLPTVLLDYILCLYRDVADVHVGWPTLTCPCEGVHRRTSLMSSSLLLQQCPTCLVHLIRMVLEMGSRWPYSWCFVVCCFQDLFNIAHSILVQFPSSFFSICLVSVHMVHPYSRIDITASWKKLCFILLDKSNFHMIYNLLIAVHHLEGRCLLFE